MSIETPLIELLESLKECAHDLKVLYVEDDFQIQEQYQHFLSKIFLYIDTANNGKNGLKMALKNHYDIIISDIQMPILDGLSMLQQIKWHNPDQATLLITAYKEVDYLHDSIELGVDGYLYKPIDQTKTIKTLHKIAARLKMQKEIEAHKISLEKMLETKAREIIHIQSTDHITGLSSLTKLEQDILINPTYSLGLLKIKNFKNINDLYGYEKGNQLLKQVAKFLEKTIIEEFFIPNCTLYRLSGAHFVILSKIDIGSLEKYVHLIIEQFEATEFKLDERLMLFEMDAGIVGCEDGLSISHADSALREAEISGNIIAYHENISIIKQRSDMLHCEDQIKRAIKEDRFIPYYQPIINNKTQTIYKYEALARLELNDQDHTIIYPGTFIPVSKKTKTYHLITRLIIQKALHDFKDSECMISLNISIDDIKHRSTCEFIFEQIALFPNPERIVFELLESEGIGSYDQAKHFFTEVKKYGCRVAIDDFGSGYSNFEHLANLNIDYIKIDGSLISKLKADYMSYVIVEMISTIALKMGITSIAEYVADKEINTLVSKLNIHESQGFLYGKATPFNESMKRIKPAVFTIAH
jgi:EAL domain-containing protein (putative c-di-GMP-specific phosphodiesterase class I)/PleD family two-component response regulator